MEDTREEIVVVKNSDSLHHPEQLYREIRDRLIQGECAALATVIALSGSGPREPGAAMLVLEDGRTLGTVGGGLLEAQVIEIARRVLHERVPACGTFSLSESEVEAGGMLCGGRVEVLVDFLDAGAPTYGRILAAALKAQEAGRRCWLATSIRGADSEGSLRTGLGLLDGEEFDPGTLDAACRKPERLRMSRCETDPLLVHFDDVRCFLQPVAPRESVFLFGAGHVARELSPLCSALGFRIVVIDDRPDCANAERFPQAADIRVVDSFDTSLHQMDIGDSAFIIIMTNGHAHDRTVLAGALKTPARYIGMIASRRKRDLIFRSLREEGVAAEALARVYSPIGLDIGARTPAEIAVSIAAELIAVRTKKSLKGNTTYS